MDAKQARQLQQISHDWEQVGSNLPHPSGFVRAGDQPGSTYNFGGRGVTPFQLRDGLLVLLVLKGNKSTIEPYLPEIGARLVRLGHPVSGIEAVEADDLAQLFARELIDTALRSATPTTE